MRTAVKPLFAMTAADLMTTTVTMIPQAMSLQGAAHLLAQARVTGAPVVDTEGRCIGVLSGTDFVAWAERGDHAAKQRGGYSNGAHCAWQMMEIESLPRDEVSRYMTADPVTVKPATLIGELARMMVDAHIHRVIVVDERRRPNGIVTSTDLLAAMANAAGNSMPARV